MRAKSCLSPAVGVRVGIETLPCPLRCEKTVSATPWSLGRNGWLGAWGRGGVSKGGVGVSCWGLMRGVVEKAHQPPQPLHGHFVRVACGRWRAGVRKPVRMVLVGWWLGSWAAGLTRLEEQARLFYYTTVPAYHIRSDHTRREEQTHLFYYTTVLLHYTIQYCTIQYPA